MDRNIILVTSLIDCFDNRTVSDADDGYFEQIVKATVNDTTVEYTIYRDFEGCNITGIEKHFQNLPYLENGKKCYDDDLTFLDNLFKHTTSIDEMDQKLFEAEIGEDVTIKCDVCLGGDDYHTQTENVTFKVTYNEANIIDEGGPDLY